MMLSNTSRVASRIVGTTTTTRLGILPAVFGISSPSTSVLVLSIKRSYHENIVEHYENPRNVGSLDKNELSVGTVRRTLNVLYKVEVRNWRTYT